MTASWHAIHVDEPLLAFGHDQTGNHPKDGLFLLGPVASNQNPVRMDVGVIATPAGLEKYPKWVGAIEKFIDVPPPAPDRKRNEANTFVWPGFQAVYGAAWPSKPFATCLIDADELSRRILSADRHHAIYSAVALYQQKKPTPTTLRTIPTIIMVETSVTNGQTGAPSTTTTAHRSRRRWAAAASRSV